nr:MAG TPA: hypothetical protein [Caudoviricetes sp.]
MPLFLFFARINIHIKNKKYEYKELTTMRINAII